MPQRKVVSEDRATKPQAILVLALVAVGIGNITFPSSIPLFSSLYLPVSLALIFAYLVVNAGRAGRQLRYPMLVLLTFLSFLPGFLITPLNSYGETKFLAIIIAFLLVVAPSAFRSVTQNIGLSLKAILFLSVGTSSFLLVLGEPDVAGRLTLWSLNPIGIGRVVGVGVVISAALLVTKWKLIKPFWLLLVPAVIVCLGATVQTGSRGPLLAILVSIVSVLLVSGVATSFIQRLAVVIFLAVGTMLLYSSSILDSTRITSSDASGRDLLFSAAFDAIRSNPVGIGWGNFYLEGPNFSRVDEYTLYPHNILLEVGAEGGWFALLSFIVLLLFSLRNLLVGAQAGNYVAVVVLSILVFTLVNALLSSDIVGNRLLWLSIGFSLLPFSPKRRLTGSKQLQSLSGPTSKERVLR